MFIKKSGNYQEVIKLNNIELCGILKDIQHSHDIGDISFDKASLIVKRSDSKEDIINLRFKTFSNRYKDGDTVRLTGNIRSYSCRVAEDKNKVTIYVFTYFDYPEIEDGTTNSATIDGRICKINPLRKSKNEKKNIHFIVANNLVVSDKKRLNSYIPCIAWGSLAEEISKFGVNTNLKLEGELRSREHKKVHDNGDVEFRVAHEFLVTGYEVVE